MVADAAANGWGAQCYDYIVRFEREFATYAGASLAVATSSCTGAMHLGLAAMEIGPGDEVILADTNWIATVSPIVHLGATPVFVDVEPEHWCIDPSKVREVISPRTKAIIATHLYGNVCDLDALLDIEDEFDIPVIEDSAEAIGASHRGRRTGGIGRFGVFSFHGTKTMTTGEGGMFVTNDPELYEKVLTMSNHGRSRSQTKQFWPDMVGYKFKMSNIQAALGCAQLSRIDDLVSRKAAIMEQYRERLGLREHIQVNVERDGCENGWWMPTVVWSEDLGVSRDVVREALVREGIDARVFFPPLSSLPMFDEESTPVAHSLPDRAMNLPSFHDMTDGDIDEICDIIKSVLERSS